MKKILKNVKKGSFVLILFFGTLGINHGKVYSQGFNPLNLGQQPVQIQQSAMKFNIHDPNADQNLAMLQQHAMNLQQQVAAIQANLALAQAQLQAVQQAQEEQAQAQESDEGGGDLPLVKRTHS